MVLEEEGVEEVVEEAGEIEEVWGAREDEESG